MLRIILALLFTVILGIAVAAWLTVRSLGGFVETDGVFAGDCIQIDGVVGAEDIEIDHASGQVFVSSVDRRSDGARGALYVLDADSNETAPTLVDLTRGVPAEFSPHGLSILGLDSGEIYVLVINHAGPENEDGHRTSVIEVYRQDDTGLLVHETTLSHALIRNPNDLAAIGTRAFYVTNDLGAPKHDRQRQQIEIMTRQAGGSVVFYDNGDARIAYPDIRYANGIAVADNETDVYVSELLEQRILMLERQTLDGELSGGRALITPGMFPDNLDLDDDGRLWVGGHPNLLDFTRHTTTPDHDSAGIVQVRSDTGEMTNRFATSGTLISGLSVAARHDNHLFIGSVFDPHILKCRMAER